MCCLKGDKWDVLVIDINSSDPNSDLWGPTKDFVDEAFLNDCKSILTDNGRVNLTKFAIV